jgi:hypothetical protein
MRQAGEGMKRLAFKLALFLLLGPIVNVAVAWLCYLTVDPSDGIRKEQSGYRWPPPQTWQDIATWQKVGRERVEIGLWTYRGGGHFEEGTKLPTRQIITVSERAGFPLVALERRFNVPGAIAADKSLPLRPIWIGFVTNSVLFAMFLGVASMMPEIRRIQRVMRGLCPKCAYDLRGSASTTCPECGKVSA